MPATAHQIDRISDAIADALERGDGAALSAVHAPGAQIWHSHDRLWTDAAENIQHLGQFGQMATDIKVEFVSRTPTSDGFVCEYVLQATGRSNGDKLELHNCIVMVCDDSGLITAAREYVDRYAAG